MTFQGVKYHLSTLPRARRAELARILREHHAIRADSVFNATYIITNSEVFEGSRDIDTEKVSIVSDLWVEHSIASQKIQQACYYRFSVQTILWSHCMFSRRHFTRAMKKF
ncbi:hypothetical protein B0H13DRAFT_2360807 [Mycena leptocephala]|nr:hypothetical protein B0H13DRAFT_2360807 [Mycena leptocephala]